ncbi:MAG: MBOAT family protein [Lachnospiraceae bacterium]|nr:MBOAT family protein [Lachnospiraceae bacterium]
MVFSSTVFLFLFLPLVLIGYYNPVIKSRKFKNVFLLLASLLFYWWGEPVFVFLMIFSILTTWYLGIKLQQTRSKKILIIGISYHTALLFIFKYLTFAARELGLLIHLDLPTIQIALPIGISFFTFQLMSYLFDIYYQDAEAQRSPLYVGLYTALFPQLIAGPIVRYKQVALQISDREESFSKISVGMHRFVYGLGKKVLIADYMAVIADKVFSEPGTHSVLTAWLGIIAYTFQIYFDFSGYSDMAIGLGKMFGFDFAENFNYPYISKSITEYWKRWHISMGSWFRDYIYIPLGGSRKGKKRWIFNLFIVWLLTGIWHGANWTFILWGLLFFVVLLLEKITDFPKKIGIFSYLYVGLVLIFTGVVIRSESLTEAAAYIGNMIGIGAGYVYDTDFTYLLKGSFFLLLIAAVGSTPIFPKCRDALQKRHMGWIEEIWLLLVFVWSILAVVSSSYNPFIYFNF